MVTCHPNFPEGKVYEGHANVWKTTEEMAGLKVIRVKTYIAANRGTARRMADFISFFITGGLAATLAPKHDVIVATSPQFFAAEPETRRDGLIGRVRTVLLFRSCGRFGPA